MKTILLELDDRIARDLERIAPAKKRMRAEFIRLAIRRAIDLELDRATEAAYLQEPLERGLAASDRAGWDPHNALARPRKPSRSRPSKRAA